MKLQNSVDWEIHGFDGRRNKRTKPLSNDSFNVFKSSMVAAATVPCNSQLIPAMKPGRCLSNAQITDLTEALYSLGAKTLTKGSLVLECGNNISLGALGDFDAAVKYKAGVLTRAERLAKLEQARERAAAAMTAYPNPPPTTAAPTDKPGVLDETPKTINPTEGAKRLPLYYHCPPHAVAIIVVPPLADEVDFDLIFYGLEATPVACGDNDNSGKALPTTIIHDSNHDEKSKDGSDDNSAHEEEKPGPLTQMWEAALFDELMVLD